MPLPRFQNLEASRRQAILKAAVHEFGERGFAGASYNRIIERAGISKGAMYYYFADKDDLFRTVLDAAMAEWFAQVGVPFRADDGGSFWGACEAMYERSLLFMLADPLNAGMCLTITRAREQLEGHPALLELNAKMQAWTAELVRHGREVGAVRTDVPEDLMVQVAISMMEAGDRWLAARWGEMTPGAARSSARMMVGLLRRVAEKENP